jgi:hypothetical protein
VLAHFSTGGESTHPHILSAQGKRLDVVGRKVSRSEIGFLDRCERRYRRLLRLVGPGFGLSSKSFSFSIMVDL